MTNKLSPSQMEELAKWHVYQRDMHKELSQNNNDIADLNG